MLYNIPTYENALEISNAGVGFYETKFNISGYDVSVFNYRITTYNDFKKYEQLGSFELRGLTFVFNTDGTLYKRYLMLNKFFNLNENQDNLYHLLKDKKIKDVMDKKDGSLITFIRLPNGSVISKTKVGFTNEQANATNDIYKKNENLRNFVNYCLDNNLSAQFEYISPFNRVVLHYSETKLVLIRVRNNDTGEYYNIDDISKNFNIDLCEYEKYNDLDEMIELSENLLDKEGWVISFTDDHMIKLKCKDYLLRHRLLTETLYRENDIIDLIINEKIDDVVSQLKESDVEIRNKVDELIKTINKYIDTIKKETYVLFNIYTNEYKSDIKNFSIDYKKNKIFHFFIQYRKGDDLENYIKKYLLKITYRLEEARSWFKDWN